MSLRPYATTRNQKAQRQPPEKRKDSQPEVKEPTVEADSPARKTQRVEETGKETSVRLSSKSGSSKQPWCLI
eukprot:m.251902 g.251902  ORF g.251902 m.251902 type:complete len:72 (+) comp16153_c0_seq1:373-588(+)